MGENRPNQSKLAEVFVGSVSAELVTKGVTHPFDTLKTRLQYLVLPPRSGAAHSLPILGDLRYGWRLLKAATRTQHSLSDPLTHPRRQWHAIRAGVASLYRGLTPQLAGTVPIAMVYMPCYELTKSAVQGTWLEPTPIAGVATGVASAVVRVPVSVIKSRLQLGMHSSVQAAAAGAWRGEGGGLFAGFRATLALDVTYAAVQFTCLEQFRQLAARARADGSGADPSQLSTGENAAIGFCTGVVSAAVTEPLDVVRTRLMTQRASGPGAFGYKGLAHGLRKAVEAEGLPAMWKGLLPRLFIKGIGSLIWYTVYMEARALYRKGTQPSEEAR